MSLYSNLLTVLTPYANKIKQNEIDIRTAISLSGGAPIVVGSTSAMTDTEQIYVLSTDGNWYYHNGSAWVAGGEYGAVSTDTTLTQSGIPADAKAVGDEIADLKDELKDYTIPSRNLFDRHNADIRDGVINASTGVFSPLVNCKAVIIPITVTNQTHVTVHRTVISSRYIIGAYTEKVVSGSVAKSVVNGANHETVTIVVDNTIKYIAVYCISLQESEGITIDVVIKDLMVQFGSEFTGYEPYRVSFISQKSIDDTKLVDSLNLKIDNGNRAYSDVIDLTEATTEIEYVQSFSANDTIASVPSSMSFRGFGTRYPTPEYPISAVKIYCYVGSSGTSKVPVTFEIRKDDFSTILATSTALAVPNVPQFILFEFNEQIETSESNLYFVAYVGSGFGLIGAGQSVTFESCSATETYKNRYMISDGTWGQVSNISNYPLQIWTYTGKLAPALKSVTTKVANEQTFSANDTIGTLSSYATNQRGRGTRYPTPEYPISAVKIYCYVGSSGTDKVSVTFEIRKDDFSTVLATATSLAVPNMPQFIMFEFSEPLETSEENLYFVAYVESGYTLIGAGQSVTFESCSATETYKNRYMISDGTWGYVNNISNYPLQIWTYKNILVSKNNKSNIIYVGMSDDCDYQTIQDAIDNANDRITNPVTIYIFNGEYDQFSMINADRNVIHYISLIGQSRDGVIVRGNKGIYEEPTAEIHTEGTIQNITFIQETSVNTQEETTTNYNYCYAVHDDYPACNTEYNNCKFVSNAGPAVGMGIKSDTMKTFRNCLFHCNGDGTFGAITMGAIFTHGEMRNDATNQGLTLENCTAINDNGANGLYIGASGTYTGVSFNGHIRNCGSFGNGVAAAYCIMPLTYSYGNNVDTLNVI